MASAMGDVEKMISVGLIWGATNAFMKKGAIIWEQTLISSSSSSSSSPKQPSPNLRHRIISSLQNYLKLVLTWQYSLPLILNLTASASFFAILGQTPISVAVPVTNATTFCATAVVGWILGEEIRTWYALFGTFVTVLGVWLCAVS